MHTLCKRDERQTAAFNKKLLKINIEGLENESEFECFILSSNFQTLFNSPRLEHFCVEEWIFATVVLVSGGVSNRT